MVLLSCRLLLWAWKACGVSGAVPQPDNPILLLPVLVWLQDRAGLVRKTTGVIFM